MSLGSVRGLTCVLGGGALALPGAALRLTVVLCAPLSALTTTSLRGQTTRRGDGPSRVPHWLSVKRCRFSAVSVKEETLAWLQDRCLRPSPCPVFTSVWPEVRR